MPISQAQTSQAPQSLLKLDYDRGRLLDFMTSTLTATPFAVAEHGWSKWFVKPSAEKMLLLLIGFVRELHHIGNIEQDIFHPVAGAIIVRNRVVGGGQSSQAPGGGGK